MRSRRYAELKRLEARRYALRLQLMSDRATSPGRGDQQVAHAPSGALPVAPTEDVVLRQKETPHDQPAS